MHFSKEPAEGEHKCKKESDYFCVFACELERTYSFETAWAWEVGGGGAAAFLLRVPVSGVVLAAVTAVVDDTVLVAAVIDVEAIAVEEVITTSDWLPTIDSTPLWTLWTTAEASLRININAPLLSYNGYLGNEGKLCLQNHEKITMILADYRVMHSPCQGSRN